MTFEERVNQKEEEILAKKLITPLMFFEEEPHGENAPIKFFKPIEVQSEERIHSLAVSLVKREGYSENSPEPQCAAIQPEPQCNTIKPEPPFIEIQPELQCATIQSEPQCDTVQSEPPFTETQPEPQFCRQNRLTLNRSASLNNSQETMWFLLM